MCSVNYFIQSKYELYTGRHKTIMATLTQEFLDTAWSNLESKKEYKAARNAVSKTDVLTIVEDREVLTSVNHIYSNQCTTEGKATSQKSSGRCWMFAMCNVGLLRSLKSQHSCY